MDAWNQKCSCPSWVPTADGIHKRISKILIIYPFCVTVSLFGSSLERRKMEHSLRYFNTSYWFTRKCPLLKDAQCICTVLINENTFNLSLSKSNFIFYLSFFHLSSSGWIFSLRRFFLFYSQNKKKIIGVQSNRHVFYLTLISKENI